MKKNLCLLISLMVLLAGMHAFASEAGMAFDVGRRTLDDYTGPAGAVTVPAYIQDTPVETIGTGVFNDVAGLTELILPETVRTISGSAVSFLTDLASIDLPEGLVVVGDNCFNNMYGLSELTIPASVSYIGDNSFGDLAGVGTITFEGPCPHFAGSAFSWLPGGAVIRVPDDCLEDYLAAFDNMSVYAEVAASGQNAVVWDYTCDPARFGFDAATGTITYYMGADVRLDIPTQIDGVDVTAIGPGAFAGNDAITYVTLPEGLTEIGEGAFEYCSGLLHVEFPSTLKTIGDRAFADGMNAKGISLPEGLETIGAEAFANCYMLMDPLHLPEGLISIDERAFSGCGWLSEVYIPETVTAIGENAFADCGMSYVVFEGIDLPEMAENAFAGCSYLADIDLHTAASKQDMLALQATVDALGLECRVWRMQNPHVDYINDGLDIYEDGVLVAYTGAQTHIRPWDTFDDVTVTALGDGAFKGNSCIEYFAVCYNDCFTTIGAEAFADSSVAYIDLFDSVTTIGEGAFRNCANLSEIVIPESVTSIAYDAFEGCTGLEKVTFLCDPAILTEGMLDSCIALSEVSGPDMEALEIALFGLPEVIITRQPEDVFAPSGEWAEVSIEAEGVDLSYAWYVMYPTEVDYVLDETCTGSTYGLYMDADSDFTGVYCVVTDKYGTSAQSDVVSFLIDEPEVEFTPVPVGPEGDPFLGLWHGVSLEDAGENVTLSDIGLVMDFSFNADGTVEIWDGEYTETGVWYVDGGTVDVMGAVGAITEDGSLCLDDGGTKITFVRGDASAIPMQSAEAPYEVPAEIPAEIAEEASAPADVLEVKFVCVNADVESYTLDASMLGGEYSLVFHEGGSCDFVVVGAAMPPMPWSANDAGNFVIDYYGTPMEASWTDAGFDLDYFGTMLMHFVPEF